MKIIHIIPSLAKGGAERLVIDIVINMKERGLDVLLITFSQVNDYAEYTKDLNIKTVNVAVFTSLWKANKIDVEALQNLIDNFNPDVIHSHLFQAEYVSRFCLFPKARWFSHCHDNMVQFENLGLKMLFSKESIVKFYEKRKLLFLYKKNGGTTFIAVSKNNYSYFQRVVSRFAIYLLPNAIKYDRFKYSVSVERNKKKLTLVNVGSLVPNKNQIFLLKVADILQTKNVDFELHLVGEGYCRELLESQIESLNLGSKVKLHGNVLKVESILWKAHLYVHSSFSESFGLTMIEAMAAGLPVVCLDAKGNRDIVEEGRNGFMIQERDPEVFTKTLIDLWDNKSQLLGLSNYAITFAKNYDIDNYTSRLVEVYQNHKSFSKHQLDVVL
jgi:glycosyltransferase involved in cell wall biosynthesis